MVPDADKEEEDEDLIRSVTLQNAQSILEARRKALLSLQQQSAWFRVTLASIADGVISTDGEGRITFMNRMAESLSGWGQADALGHPLREIFKTFDGKTGKPVESIPLSLTDELAPDEGSNPRVLKAKNGSVTLVEKSVASIPDEHGEPAGFVVVFRDVTQQQSVVDDLRTSEARKSGLFEAALDCIISIDHQGLIVEFNAAAEKTFGHRREEVIGLEMASVIVPPSHRDNHRKGLKRYLETRESHILNQRLELSALYSDGTEFPVELTVVLTSGEDPPAFTAFLRDITERKAMENNLRDLAAHLSELDRRKNEFLAMLAHELRNPLAPILNAVKIVQVGGAKDEAVSAAADVMERQIGHMARLVDDLLDISRISRGKIELRKDCVDLASVVRQAVETSLPLVEIGEHPLTVRLPSQPLFVRGDSLRLIQLFGNLLNNACKYSNPKGEIELVCSEDKDEVLVTIRDEGLGIPESMLESIFEMFTQGDRSMERAQGGLGIGLSLVKSIAELHGGWVRAESRGVGKGSLFVVGLPILSEGRETEREKPEAEPSVNVPKRILVVDDNQDSANTLAALLQLSGHETIAVFDGAAALEAASSMKLDAIVLDIGLPKMNGFEVARAIRRQPWGRDLLLVALTGWGEAKDRQKSKEAGFDFHMVKPVDHQALSQIFRGMPPDLESRSL